MVCTDPSVLRKRRPTLEPNNGLASGEDEKQPRGDEPTSSSGTASGPEIDSEAVVDQRGDGNESVDEDNA